MKRSDPAPSRFSTSSPCRCGYAGEGAHACHRCKRPGTPRFIAALTCVLVGNKDGEPTGSRETCACDDCWAAFVTDDQFNTRTRRKRRRAITPLVAVAVLMLGLGSGIGCIPLTTNGTRYVCTVSGDLPTHTIAVCEKTALAAALAEIATEPKGTNADAHCVVMIPLRDCPLEPVTSTSRDAMPEATR